MFGGAKDDACSGLDCRLFELVFHQCEDFESSVVSVRHASSKSGEVREVREEQLAVAPEAEVPLRQARSEVRGRGSRDVELVEKVEFESVPRSSRVFLEEHLRASFSVADGRLHMCHEICEERVRRGILESKDCSDSSAAVLPIERAAPRVVEQQVRVDRAGSRIPERLNYSVLRSNPDPNERLLLRV